MSFPFNARHGLVIVPVEITGPSGVAVVQLAADTGATRTLVSSTLLLLLGYDPAAAPQRVHVTTGSGVAVVPRLPVTTIRALGQDRTNFPVLGHTLPPSATVDGLLGLDFYRGHVLTLDFQQGRISLL